MKSAVLSSRSSETSLASPAPEVRSPRAPARVEAVEASEPDTHYSVQEQLVAVQAASLADFAGQDQVRAEAQALAAALKEHPEQVEPRDALDVSKLPRLSGHLDVEA